MPTPESQLYEVVARALASGDMRDAMVACRELNTEYPEYFEGWRVAGEIHTAMQKADALLFSTERALAIRPNDPQVLLQRIEALVGADRIDEASERLTLLKDIDLGDAQLHDRAAMHMASLDMHDEACGQYQKALALDPNSSTLLFNLATAQRFTGQIDESVASLDRALTINPRNYEAQAMRSSLKTQLAELNHIDELKALLDETGISDNGEVSLCYALAKECDDIDAIDEAFAYLSRGARSRRSRMDYSVDTDIHVIEQLQSVYSEAFFREPAVGEASAEPIFILGLPRSGTTLVERILGSHSRVHAAGELDNFGRQMTRLLVQSGSSSDADQLDVITSAATLDMQELGHSYIQSTRPQTGLTPHFIDKLPFNYLYAGLIHKALPNARIINLVRHPMASCFSMYKQLFRDPYPFSYDLEDVGRYFLAYSDLMAHWHHVMPGVIHTVHYECMVDDTEGETRRLLEFCGLAWEDACMRFYENKQASTTASAAQVRKPVYRSSLDRWKKYRDYLGPLESVLLTAGVNLSPAQTES